MIVIAGTIVMDPAKVERAKDLVAVLMAETRKEAGCVNYEFFAALDEPGRFHVFEEWETPEANAAHSASTHLAAFYQAIPELGVTSAELFRYEAASKTPL